MSGLDGQARWWFLRYHDPQAHLRLRVTVPTDRFAATADRIGSWSQQLREAGLIASAQWDTYFPETARFGGRTAMDTAEAYFTADSAAAVAQLTANRQPGGADLRALIAASMLDIAVCLFGNPDGAMRWLIDHARTDQPGPSRALYDQALLLANPNDRRALAAQPVGDQIVASWTRRREALSAYRHVLTETGTPSADVLLPELLHLHHARMAGTALKNERACLHLARAAAVRWSARTRRDHESP